MGRLNLENNSHAESPKNSEQLDYLDGWRGFAVLLLLIGHFFPYWRLDFGTVGVNFFFVLSGFLMAKQLFLHQTSIPVFYKRRISRIFPALYLFIILTVVFYFAANLPISWEVVAGSAGLIRNYYPGGFGNKLPFDNIWSLSVEEHSYILLSIIALAVRGNISRQRILLGVFTCAFVLISAWYVWRFPGPHLYDEKLIHSEVSAFGIFCSGFFLLCFGYRKDRKIPSFIFYTLPIIGILSHYHSVPYTLTLIVGVGSLALLINILHKAPAWMLRVLSFSVFRNLGLWSYSIYLWQQPFFVLKNKGVLPTTTALMLALLVGMLSYFLVESPVRKYLNRTWARKDIASFKHFPSSGTISTRETV
jgi:peptidoglycan/LPS O-acetylase OafA/YrhL